jgi:small subunit ribosomal protein S6
LETVVTKRLYEAMFLVDSAQAAADWDGTLAVINNIMQRAGAEVVSLRKWQERKLTYDIDHKSRGTYILCYFNADSRRISGIEKDVQLSEKIMRVLILTTAGRPAELIEKDIAGLPEEKPAELVADSEDSDRRPRRSRPDDDDEPEGDDTPVDENESDTDDTEAADD